MAPHPDAGAFFVVPYVHRSLFPGVQRKYLTGTNTKQMQTLFVRIILLLLLFITTGCPYESEVPIDEPSVAIPPTLPGVWKGLSDSGAVITVTPADAYTFEISYYKQTDGTKYYSAHLSELRNVLLINLHPKKPVATGLSGAYAFYKFELSDNGKHLTLTPVTENIKEKFTSSHRQKAFFKKYVHTSFFYDADEELEYEKIE